MIFFTARRSLLLCVCVCVCVVAPSVLHVQVKGAPAFSLSLSSVCFPPHCADCRSTHVTRSVSFLSCFFWSFVFGGRNVTTCSKKTWHKLTAARQVGKLHDAKRGDSPRRCVVPDMHTHGQDGEISSVGSRWDVISHLHSILTKPTNMRPSSCGRVAGSGSVERFSVRLVWEWHGNGTSGTPRSSSDQATPPFSL